MPDDGQDGPGTPAPPSTPDAPAAAPPAPGGQDGSDDAPTTGTVRRRTVGEFARWWTVTRHQLAHYVRSYRFLGLLAFVGFISLLTLAFQLDAGVDAVRIQQLNKSSEYLSNFLDYTGLWIILAAAFFAGDALSVDFSTGTGYYMLVLPVRRRTLLAGRYSAAIVVTLAIVAVYYVAAFLGGVYFFGASAIRWDLAALSFGIAALFTLAALAVAFTMSAFFRSPAAGVLVTVLVLYVGFTTLQGVVELAGVEPWFSLTYAGGAMAAILDTDFVHFQSIPLGEDQYYTIWSANVGEGVLIMLGYLAVFLGLSAYLYGRKESTG
ncbi:MAG TPA: ABC transporter permease [Thermoplasmata archaeon]|nr:ABC transporter permease [Thermoplasmata archaeon]